MAENQPQIEVNDGRSVDAGRQPGDDRPVKAKDDVTLLNALRSCKHEALNARRSRMHKNRDNRRAYLGLQDWGHKKKGQSKEFLPKTAEAVEQFVAFVKKGLTGFGDYFDVELSTGSQSLLSGAAIRKLIDCHLKDCLIEDNRTGTFEVQLSEGIKVGALEALMIFKVHGNFVNSTRYEATEDEVEPRRSEVNHWKLRVDLIPPEHYFPDPTGAGLYEIHSCERDLSYVVKRAKEGVYSQAVVKRLEEDFRQNEEEKRRALDRGHDETIKPSFRKKVVIDEFWGTILDKDGKVVMENAFFAVANDKYIIRQPIKNPFWHGESPFIAIPLIKVPFSQWHKALFDHAVQINFALNEVYNLIIDGGIASVWGIKQARIDDLERPEQVSGGVAQGDTLLVKSTLPHGAKVLETVSEGQIPGDAMALFEMLSREFSASALTNELKMGSMPAKDVLATEIVEMSQSQAVTMDGIITDIEYYIVIMLRKIWLTILQNMDNLPTQKVIEVIGTRAAFNLSRMTPSQRFATMGSDYGIKVYGLSEVMTRTRDFQKMMAMLQVVIANPMLFQAFFQKYSPNRVLSSMMKMLGINPEQLQRDERESNFIQDELADMMMFAQAFGAGAGGGAANAQSVAGDGTNGQEVPAEIAAIGNPSAGLAGAGQS
jgi:hypothetical protein